MAEEFKNVPEHETPKVAVEESSETKTGEVKDRGLFDFLGKKEEAKPTLESEFEHKTQVSEPTLLEKLHQKHEEEEENKPSLLHKLHRSNSSSSSSSDEEGEEKKKKKEKKKIVEGEEKTEEEKKGIMDKIKEKLPGHGTKPEDDVPATVTSEPVEHPEEKKGIMEKIKEKLPGYHAKNSEEEDKKVKESD